MIPKPIIGYKFKTVWSLEDSDKAVFDFHKSKELSEASKKEGFATILVVHEDLLFCYSPIEEVVFSDEEEALHYLLEYGCIANLANLDNKDESDIHEKLSTTKVLRVDDYDGLFYLSNHEGRILVELEMTVLNVTSLHEPF